MNLTDPRLPDLLDMLRNKGVRAFTVDGDKLHVEFNAPEPQVGELAAAPSDAGAETCRCGHKTYEHQNGLCIVGCDAEKCIEAAKAN